MVRVLLNSSTTITALNVFCSIEMCFRLQKRILDFKAYSISAIPDAKHSSSCVKSCFVEELRENISSMSNDQNICATIIAVMTPTALNSKHHAYYGFKIVIIKYINCKMSAQDSKIDSRCF